MGKFCLICIRGGPLQWRPWKCTRHYARLTFQRDGDLDKLLSVAGPCISNVLEFSAKLIGHSDSLNQDLFGSKDELVAALDRDGLRNWLTMFQTDLRDFFQ